MVITWSPLGHTDHTDVTLLRAIQNQVHLWLYISLPCYSQKHRWSGRNESNHWVLMINIKWNNCKFILWRIACTMAIVGNCGQLWALMGTHEHIPEHQWDSGRSQWIVDGNGLQLIERIDAQCGWHALRSEAVMKHWWGSGGTAGPTNRSGVRPT